jgi:hypothetical protein
MLEKKRINYSLIKGGVKDRDEQVARFQNDPMYLSLLDRWRLRDWASHSQRQARWCFILWITRCRISSNASPHPSRVSVCLYLHLYHRAGYSRRKVLKALKNKANLARRWLMIIATGNNPFI